MRALRAELDKCRHTWIFLLALAPGAGLASLKVLGFWIRGADDLGPENYNWPFFLSIGAELWERLVLPFLAVSATAWTAWMESENDTWKVTLSQPVSRSAVFSAKFILACGLLALAELSWAISHWAGGWLLQLPAPSLSGQLFARAGLMMAALAPLLAVQHGIAYRSRGLALPLTAGLAGTVAGVLMAGKSWALLLPWTYPALGGTRLWEALTMTAAVLALGLLAVNSRVSMRRLGWTSPLRSALAAVATTAASRPSREVPAARGRTIQRNPAVRKPRSQWRRLAEAEALKLHRSGALRAALLGPLLFSGLVTINFLTRAGIQESELWSWAMYFQVIRALWGVFGCALLAGVLAALWMGVEHRNDNWSLLLAQPVSRRGLLLAKLGAVAALTAGSALVLFLSGLCGGVLVGLSGPLPWREAAVLSGSVLALLPVVLLQCGLSLRFHSFLLPVGMGLMAHFASAVAANVAIMGVRPGYYSPWAILLRALQVGGPQQAATTFDLAISTAMALLFLLLLLVLPLTDHPRFAR
ncbi:MAG TPA: ABC transporter permease [Acidobacteriota bacterium]|nr:ABC transporter permease [Acidobacteriota bacterium]